MRKTTEMTNLQKGQMVWTDEAGVTVSTVEKALRHLKLATGEKEQRNRPHPLW